MEPSALKQAVDAAMPLGIELLDTLRTQTADRAGVSRETYGPKEQFAHDLLRGTAENLDLETRIDFAGNLYMTLPGRDRAAPGWITGSHLDSVPMGGNYDGAAGVIAGVVALAALRKSAHLPARDVTVMGIRAEEASSWFAGSHNGHLGSRAALGMLPRAELDGAINSRSGKTLAQHIADAGFDVDAISAGRQALNRERYLGYIELHIEQGPVLENRAVPVGIVTGIRGSARLRSARCIGEYTHSGAVPHEYRSDAVLATTELCYVLDREWEAVRKAGGDLVFTVGKLYTDPKAHALTKVPGEIAFTVDLRSQELGTLEEMIAKTRALADEIGRRRRVRFELGEFNISPPATMDAALQTQLATGARELGINTMALPSGAGHDAQDFAHAGYPAAMIFVRNAHGSHNPHEALDPADLALGTQLLTRFLAS
ncbi:MAG TPA: hydantoinase/carbamoylase family amidase [Burkholderiales bacterium]|jgi:N-carbamoyl-L-amino-acid hydrolase|nr:hydantoinase/carbamoylase family amidase [Burkholderiales bacterium]